MKVGVLFVSVFFLSIPAWGDDSNFSTRLYAKFQVRACTICHDYFEKERDGLGSKSHKGRSPDMCLVCHTEGVTGFKHADEWFAQPGLYTSGMNPQQTCETVRTAMHTQFKSKKLVARQMEEHLLNDPRVLWGIEGATPQSGQLPGGGKEVDLVKGGLATWKEQVKAWIDGGMKCQ